jgi:regulator of PEP synthase PpsR (kinase-PPPase family)
MIDNFAEGADFQKAKIFAATRTFAVAPWDEDVKPKPIFAVSDSTGNVAARLAMAAFQQFGPGVKADIHTKPGVISDEGVCEVVHSAACLAPKKALAIEKSGAMLVYTLASQKLGALLSDECNKKGVPCINALEPVLMSMEKRFGLTRCIDVNSEEQLKGFESGDLTVFAVSDKSGESAHEMVKAALKQFPGCGVESVTVCPEVKSLEEVKDIVQEAVHDDSLIVFTFASPGLSRYMRQECERAKLPYADVFQPVVIAFERYLNYPPVGITGGHDLKETNSARLRWQRRPLMFSH